MRWKQLAYIAALALVAQQTAKARRVDYRSPARLMAESKLVCNGIVLSIARTGLKPDTQFGNPPLEPEVVMEARIKVLHALKGKAPRALILRYNVTSSLVNIFIDASHHLSLQAGQRYRFFLVPTRFPGIYYTAMWYSSDEFYAVQKLWPDEKDDGSYLSAAALAHHGPAP